MNKYMIAKLTIGIAVVALAGAIPAGATPLQQNIVTLGAIANNSTPSVMASNASIIQSAVDSGNGADVYIPAGTFYINEPIFLDPSNVTLEGASESTSILAAGPNCKGIPVVLGSFATEEPYNVIDSDARPNVTSLYDSSVTGPIYGIRGYEEYPVPTGGHHYATLNKGTWATGQTYSPGNLVTQQLISYSPAGYYVCILSTSGIADSITQPENGTSWTTYWVRRTLLEVDFPGSSLSEGAQVSTTTGQSSRFVSGMDQYTIDLMVHNNGSTKLALPFFTAPIPVGDTILPQYQFVMRLDLDGSGNVRLMYNTNAVPPVQQALSGTISENIASGQSMRVAIQVSNNGDGSHTLALFLTNPATGTVQLAAKATLAAGLTLAPMDYGNTTLMYVLSQNTITPDDATYCGLHIESGVRYTVGTVGSAQARADSGTLNDQYRFFANDSNTVAFLPLTDDPTGSPTSPTSNLYRYGQLVTVQQGAQAGGATQTDMGFLNANLSSSNTYIGWQVIHDLTIANTPAGTVYPYGSAIMWYDYLNPICYNLNLIGGAFGMGQLPLGGPNRYSLDMRNCALQGTDNAFFAAGGVVNMTNTTVATPGRIPFAYYGVSVAMRNTTIGSSGFDSSATQSLFHFLSFGGVNFPTIDGLTLTNANAASYPTKAAFDIQYKGAYGGDTFSIRNVAANCLPSTAAFLQTDEVEAGPPEGFTIENCSVAHATGSGYASHVRSGVTQYYGRVNNCLNSFPVVAWVDPTNAGGYANSNVRTYHTDLTTFPPTTHTWTQDAHIAYNASSGSGNPYEWRCTGSGIGTASTWDYDSLNP